MSHPEQLTSSETLSSSSLASVVGQINQQMNEASTRWATAVSERVDRVISATAPGLQGLTDQVGDAILPKLREIKSAEESVRQQVADRVSGLWRQAMERVQNPLVTFDEAWLLLRAQQLDQFLEGLRDPPSDVYREVWERLASDGRMPQLRGLCLLSSLVATDRTSPSSEPV